MSNSVKSIKFVTLGFLGGSESKEFACNAGDQGLIPESGRSLGEGNGNLLQYSCLEIPWAGEPDIVHGVAKNQMQLTLSLHFFKPTVQLPSLMYVGRKYMSWSKKDFYSEPQAACGLCLHWLACPRVPWGGCGVVQVDAVHAVSVHCS